MLDQAGRYVVQLVVNDGVGDSLPDTVTITSGANTAPVANAGPDQTVAVGRTVRLEGSTSTDPDGDTLSYTWTFIRKPAGSAATLTNSKIVNPGFTLDKAGTYELRLVVQDGQQTSAPDTVIISTTNTVPVAHAGAAQTAFVGSTVQLDGSGSSDIDGQALTYRWAFTAKPAGSATTLTAATSAQPRFVIDVPGRYVVQLIVNDSVSDSLPATVAIDTQNSAPVAHAGPDQTVILGSYVLLDGSASTDLEGSRLTYNWTLTDKPADSSAALNDSSGVNPTFSADKSGTYKIRLIVSDGKLNSAPVTVTVNASASGIGQERLLPLGSYPGGVTLGDTKEVIFTVSLVGAADVTPTEVTLQALDETGTVVLYDLGSLHDDGLNGDLAEGNFVYSGVFTIRGNQAGKLLYRAKAIMPATGEITSDPYVFEVTPFKVGSQPSNLEHLLQLPNSTTEVVADEILVSFASKATKNDIEAIAISINGTILGYVPHLHIYQMRLNSGGTLQALNTAINQLSKNTLVTRALPNVILHSTGFPNDQALKDQWGVSKIGADQAALIARGREPIAILDSGIDASHPDLKGKVVPVWDFIAGNNSPDHEGNGHGTQVAGIAGAVSNNVLAMTGIAWDSPLLDIRVVNKKGRLTELSGAEGIALASSRGTKVINCSWGYNEEYLISISTYFASFFKDIFNINSINPLFTATRDAFEKGSLVVAAAGNNNTDKKFYPASFSSVMAIGGTNILDKRYIKIVSNEIVSGSNYGNWISLAAPGEDILSTVPPTGLKKEMGTSMAAPHVSGAAAVLWSLHPEWTPTQIRERLEKTAKPLEGQKLGAGRLDLFEAVFNGSFELDKEDWTDIPDINKIPDDRTKIVENWNGITATHGKKFSSTLFSIRDTLKTLLDHKVVIPDGVSKLPIRFDWQMLGTSSCAVLITLFDEAQKKVILVDGQEDPGQVWGSLVVDRNPTLMWNKYQGVFSISKGGTYYLRYILMTDCTCEEQGCHLLLDHIQLKNGNDSNGSDGGSLYNNPPIANAGPDQEKIQLGQVVKLDGSGSKDADGDVLGYKWDFISKPANSNATLDDHKAVGPQFALDKMGYYVLSLIVSDGKDISKPDTVTIKSETPVANAGPDQTVSLNAIVQLDGSSSKDIDNKPLTYHWNFLSIPTDSKAVFEEINTAKPHFNADKLGNYVVQLIVNNGEFDSRPDTVTINAKEEKP